MKAKRIIELTAEVSGLTYEQIHRSYSKTRKQEIVLVRNMAMWFVKYHTGVKFADVAESVGFTSEQRHSCAHHGVNRHACDKDANYKGIGDLHREVAMHIIWEFTDEQRRKLEVITKQNVFLTSAPDVFSDMQITKPNETLNNLNQINIRS